jgi:3-dehydroquinate dehydratase-2
MHVLIVNGPNLNLLGEREPQIYGNVSFETYFKQLSDKLEMDFSYFQSNVEGLLIDKLQGANCDGIILNAGGYTHTSVAIRDCISSIAIPVVEVHISNVANREVFRHQSMLTPVCRGLIMGFGLDVYELAALSFLMKSR